MPTDQPGGRAPSPARVGTSEPEMRTGIGTDHCPPVGCLAIRESSCLWKTLAHEKDGNGLRIRLSRDEEYDTIPLGSGSI